MRNVRIRVVVALAVAWLAALPASRADDASPASQPAGDQWRLIMPAYFWMSGIDGNVTAQGHKANVDLSFGDLVDHTDIGFQTYAELRKEKFGFYAQPNYLKLSASGSANGAKANLESQLWIVEGRASSRWWPTTTRAASRPMPRRGPGPASTCCGCS